MPNIRTCQACGYERGFHVSFEPDEAGKEHEIVLICPSCGQSYRIGWTTAQPLQRPVPGRKFGS